MGYFYSIWNSALMRDFTRAEQEKTDGAVIKTKAVRIRLYRKILVGKLPINLDPVVHANDGALMNGFEAVFLDGDVIVAGFQLDL
jgi:hypothetical protein